MQQKKWTAAALLAFFAVQAVLCDFYLVTYYANFEVWSEILPKPARFAILIFFFLFAPACYYVAGRLFRKRADRKIYLIVTFTASGLLALFGAFSMLAPSVLEIYRHINAPAYLYYALFSDTVFYISVPAMIASGVLPAFFARMGMYHNGRQHNEIKKEEPNEDSPEVA